MKKILIGLLFLLVFGGGAGAYWVWGRPHLRIFPKLADPALKTARLAPDRLQADVEAYYAGALSRHPLLDNPKTRARLRPLVDAVKAEITEPMTRLEFFRVVGRLSCFFQDGHSFLIWPYQEYGDLKDAGHQMFPFAVQVREGRLYLRKAYTLAGENLPAGLEITAINEVPVVDVLETLQQYTGGETRLLREQFVADRFPPMLWAVYGWMDAFRLVVDAGEGPRRLEVGRERKPMPIADEVAGDYHYRELRDGVGLLELVSFDTPPDAFATFVDQTFAELRANRIRTLIIDIRENTGGNTDTVTYLSRYLADKKFRLISHMTERLNKNNRGLFGFRGKEGRYLEKEWHDWEKPMAADRRFEGDVYLLVGSLSYSAAIVLATTLKDNDFAVLVGRTTGGFANQTGQGHLFNLPHSQLRAFIATRLLIRPSGDKTVGGVVPHHQVAYDREAVMAGMDPDIEKVLALIGETREQPGQGL